MKKKQKNLMVLSVFLAALTLIAIFPALSHAKNKAAPSPVPVTGQTAIYATGDDGDLQMGVRSPDPRFTDNGDGTVSDNLTGLMWTKNVQQIPGVYVWVDAISLCNDLVFAGYDDWRLPNIRELESLIAYDNTPSPVLPSGNPFINIDYGYGYILFWSSSSADEMSARGIVLDHGTQVTSIRKYELLRAWPVRGGEVKKHK